MILQKKYAYDNRQNLIQKTDRKGQVTQHTYDGLDRPIKTTYADGSTLTRTWDKGNRLTKLVDSQNGTITRAYDTLDRLTKEVTSKGTVSYSYNAASRRTAMVVSNQPKLAYTWDAAGRLTKITQAAGAANNNVAQTLTFAYDAAHRRTQMKLMNGHTVNYSYDAASQLTSITWKNASKAILGEITYTYDANGQRTNIGGSFARFNLPTDKTQTFDAANRLITHNGQAHTYDANGNLISDGANTYTWNARDQLTNITGSVSASFTYDALGRRQTKTINGVETGFVYDGLNLVQELNGTTTSNTAENVRATYILGGLDEIFAQQTGTGASAQIYSYYTDALGSVIRITDAAGTKQVDYTYDLYGGTTADAAFPNPYQYTARENDGTGLYYYRARYYSPDKLRFISEDPIGLAGGINTYAYVEGNPVSRTDSLGLLGSHVKKYLCKLLEECQWDISCVFSRTNADRKEPDKVSGGNHWDNPTMRQAENFAYAAAYNDVGYFGVLGHQLQKTLGWPLGASSRPSAEAGVAGLEGVSNQEKSPEQWKEWCNGCQ